MTAPIERMLPLYEAKMIHHYDHRWATYERDGSTRYVTVDEKRDPQFVVMPRYWVREAVVADRLEGEDARDHLLGVRDITNSTNERTVISAPFPLSAVGNNLPIILGSGETDRLSAVLSCFVLDFVARPKVGGVHLNFFIANQIPVLPPETFEEELPWKGSPVGAWLDDRALWLRSAEGWADQTKRAAIRAEIDALMFHLYGIERHDVDYIMETFPIVRRKDMTAYGEYRTKRLILEVYDEMAEAVRSDTPYESPFDEVSLSVREH